MNPIRDNDLRTIDTHLAKIRRLTNFWQVVADCELIPELFWQSEVLGVLLDDAFKNRRAGGITPLFRLWSATISGVCHINAMMKQEPTDQ